MFDQIIEDGPDQKDTNLCVPIKVTIILKHAIDEFVANIPPDIVTFKRIFYIITMMVYPRSLSGLCLNPSDDEKDVQYSSVETLLKRLKYPTYIWRSGWDWVCRFLYLNFIGEDTTIMNKFSDKNIDFTKVILHENDTFWRPLTVTGAFKKNGTVFYHQMVLEKIENHQYHLKNSRISTATSKIIISQNQEYFIPLQNFRNHNYADDDELCLFEDENIFIRAVHEVSMDENTWYLLPEAYAIFLTRKNDLLND